MLQPEHGAEQRATDEPTATFEEFFQANYAVLGRMMLLMTADRQDAEDLAQEAFSRVFERWDRVRLMDSPRGYLIRTAMNLNRKRARHQAVARRLHLRATEPLDEISAAMTRHDVRRALDGLPRTQREALILVDWAGLDATEAGKILGIAPSSVRGRLHRARGEVRSRLGERDG